MKLQELANIVDQAANEAKPVAQLSVNNDFSIDEAYEIQRLSINNRVSRGEKLIGLKMGFTSEAKMKQMGVHDMIWGRLTDTMLIDNNQKIDLQKFIHPRAEPEICFRVNKDITKTLTLEQCYESVDAMASAIEIIDSRYENFKFSLSDVIADNCSSSGVVIGKWQKPERKINTLKMAILRNGHVEAEDTSAAILGDPWKSLVAATRLAEQYRQPIKKGDIILAGAATNAIFINSNDTVLTTVEGMSEVSFTAS